MAWKHSYTVKETQLAANIVAIALGVKAPDVLNKADRGGGLIQYYISVVDGGVDYRGVPIPWSRLIWATLGKTTDFTDPIKRMWAEQSSATTWRLVVDDEIQEAMRGEWRYSSDKTLSIPLVLSYMDAGRNNDEIRETWYDDDDVRCTPTNRQLFQCEWWHENRSKLIQEMMEEVVIDREFIIPLDILI